MSRKKHVEEDPEAVAAADAEAAAEADEALSIEPTPTVWAASIGRIVIFYRGHGLPSPVPAIVTEVHENGVVHLTVFAPGAASTPKMNVPHKINADSDQSYWDWPTRI